MLQSSKEGNDLLATIDFESRKPPLRSQLSLTDDRAAMLQSCGQGFTNLLIAILLKFLYKLSRQKHVLCDMVQSH